MAHLPEGSVLSFGAPEGVKETDYYTKEVERYERYHGLPMICESGLHALIAEEVKEWLPSGKGKILDVGCGRGALSLRFSHLGHEVHAIDKFDLCMCSDRVKFIHGDAGTLNAGSDLYDVIFMVEFIEHLNSPFEVISSYVKYLKPGGKLIITTPNVDSDWSRAYFLLKGRHWYFEGENVKRDGHVSPIHRFQIEEWARQLKMNVEAYKGLLENRTDVKFGYLKLLYLMVRFHRWLKKSPVDDGKIGMYVLARGEGRM